MDEKISLQGFLMKKNDFKFKDITVLDENDLF